MKFHTQLGILLVMIVSSCGGNLVKVQKDAYSIVEISRQGNVSHFRTECRSTDAQYGIMIIAEYAHIALARDYAYFTLEKEGEKDTITFYKLMPETEKIVIEASLFLMENDQ